MLAHVSLKDKVGWKHQAIFILEVESNDQQRIKRRRATSAADARDATKEKKERYMQED
uniref:AlNc14C33G2988 protein n=1 Tax=Albugo laibachii Nc14 TaxID=890382 RepID=F0W894_9STRA|nr:AlNc14C33G2988 [Albugo laibachii Nc14]|eukprot:CCA17294.1 AlNc14C33G2988 [Albugo laibachii Nc14]